MILSLQLKRHQKIRIIINLDRKTKNRYKIYLNNPVWLFLLSFFASEMFKNSLWKFLIEKKKQDSYNFFVIKTGNSCFIISV